METIDLVQGYSRSGDMFLIVLSLLLFIVIKINYVKSDKRSALLTASFVALFAASICNVLFYQCAINESSYILIYIFRDLYNFILMGLFIVYYQYINLLINLKGRRMLSVASQLNLVIMIMADAAEIAGHFLKFGFYRDADTGLWYEPQYLKVFYIAYILQMIIIGSTLLVYRKRIIRKIVRVLIITEAMCIVVVGLQALTNSSSLMAMTFSLPILVVLFELHSSPYNLVNGARDFSVLGECIKDSYEKKKRRLYLCLKLYLDEGQEFPEELGKVFYNFYQAAFPKALLFSSDVANYCLVIPKNENSEVNSKVKYMIEHQFKEQYDVYHLRYKIVLFDDVEFDCYNTFDKCIKFWLNRLEINSMIRVGIGEMATYYSEVDIAKRIQDINDKMDLNDERVLVYCQPVKNVMTGKFDTAEALMRLKFDDIGMVFPDKFIPIAESYGYIHSLSLIILNKTCKALKELTDEGYDITRISVNFAVEEMLATDFVNDYKNIIVENGISFDKIGIEITESQQEQNYESLFKLVKSLKQLGSVIYLDDFGTGYSNFDRILKLEFDLIKMDRSLLLMAESDNSSDQLLKLFSDGFINMGYKVLCEGVETDAQEEKCKKFNMSYLQGYKYSKPIPIENLRNFLVKKEA